ncbi:MAG: hypothetical protein D3923_17135, partial [Candidatus Electrothrix sp. AR3]|nr:hypothetical protein [Candidatus Electrothrix sp. AR3]
MEGRIKLLSDFRDQSGGKADFCRLYQGGSMKRVRKGFAKTRKILEPPHLIAMQRHSYDRFLQMHIDPAQREEIGLQAIFNDIFPIT